MARKLEELIELAKQYKIDYEGLEYNDLSSKVAQAEKEAMTTNAEIVKLRKQLEAEKAKNKQMKVQYENLDDGREPTHEELMNLPIEVAPYIPSMGKLNSPKYVFEEDLGQDVNYVEHDYTKTGVPEGMQPGDERIPLQFEHKGYKQNKVKSTTAGPTANAGICLYPGDTFMTIYDDKQTGYLWADVMPFLKNLRNGYYYDKYKDRIRKSQTMIFRRYAIPKEVMDSIWIDIKKEEMKKDVEDKQFENFLKENYND